MSPSEIPWRLLLAASGAGALGAIFAAADTALTSLSATRLNALIEQAKTADRHIYERIHRDEPKLRSRYLLGRLLCTISMALLVEVALAPVYPLAAPLIALSATVLVMSLMLEVTTTLARRHADGAALAAVRYLRPLELLLLPLAVPLGFIGTRLGDKAGPPVADPRVTEAEVELMVDEVEKSGLFEREPAEMIRNLLEFPDRTAKDVMVPRAKVEAIAVTTPIARAVELVVESGHSRYPVYRDQIDNIVGLLYAKDLFRSQAGADKATSLEAVLRKANFVAESQSLSSLLREMRSLRQHMAIVVDEFGLVSGVVTLEDVLEEIVGDIRDEHDESEEPQIQELEGGRLVADAAVLVRDLSTYLGTDLGAESSADSLGRMLTRHLGKVPEVGTAIEKGGVEFIVRDWHEGRIAKVEIVRRPAQRQPALASAEGA